MSTPHLQQQVEDVHVCLFDFVEQDHAVGLAPNLQQQIRRSLSYGGAAVQRNDSSKVTTATDNVEPNAGRIVRGRLTKCRGEFALTQDSLR